MGTELNGEAITGLKVIDRGRADTHTGTLTNAGELIVQESNIQISRTSDGESGLFYSPSGGAHQIIPIYIWTYASAASEVHRFWFPYPMERSSYPASGTWGSFAPSYSGSPYTSNITSYSALRYPKGFYVSMSATAAGIMKLQASYWVEA